jgi:ribosomal protein L11 methyltransferase
VFSLLLHCEPDQEDTLSADLCEQGTAGVAEEPGGLRAFFADLSRAGELMDRFRAFAPEIRIEADTDWEQTSRDAWPPLLVGDRFYLVPPWRNEPPPPGRIRLEIVPGMACGTGHHPATQLCLEALERYLVPDAFVLDVGSGSGILSQAALLLGARCVVACDIDPEAVGVARERVHVPFFIGSVDAVAAGIADVMVANISSEVVERLRPELERVRRAGGLLIVSGFPDDDLPEGFAVLDELRQDGWACLVCR